jgi:RNA-directed DNA polymerase
MRRFIVGWKTLGHEQRLDAHIVNYADDCAPRRRERTILRNVLERHAA